MLGSRARCPDDRRAYLAASVGCKDGTRDIRVRGEALTSGAQERKMTPTMSKKRFGLKAEVIRPLARAEACASPRT